MEIKHYFAQIVDKPAGFCTAVWSRSREKPGRKKRIIATLVAVFTLAITITIILGTAKNAVNEMPCYRLKPEVLVMRHLPSWLIPYTREISPVALDKNLTTLNPNITQKIAQAYLRNPWVRSVQKISKEYPGYIAVQLVLRRPVAWVQYQGLYYLCDAQAFRLPGQYSRPEQEEYLPVIRGLENLPAPGKKWCNASLQSALIIVNHARNQKDLPYSLHEIHLTMEQGKTPGNIILKNDYLQIIWGHSLQAQFPEVSFEHRWQALKNSGPMMAELFQKSPQAHCELDIRFGYPIIRVLN